MLASITSTEFVLTGVAPLLCHGETLYSIYLSMDRPVLSEVSPLRYFKGSDKVEISNK